MRRVEVLRRDAEREYLMAVLHEERTVTAAAKRLGVVRPAFYQLLRRNRMTSKDKVENTAILRKTLKEHVDSRVKACMIDCLKKEKGVVSNAIKSSGISRLTFYNNLKKFGINLRSFSVAWWEKFSIPNLIKMGLVSSANVYVPRPGKSKRFINI